MIDLSSYSKVLQLTDGVWRAPNASEISYPAQANDAFYKIEDDSFWFKHRNEVIGKVVSRYADHSGAFLDVGAGNGFTSHHLQFMGFDPIVLEPGLHGVMNAKARGLQNLVHATLQDADFLSNRFSNIGVFDVIEHIENDLGVLIDLRRILRPKGKIFITVPAFDFLWSQNDVNAGHFRRYTIRKMKRLAASAGLKVVYDTYFFSILPPSIFLFRSVPFRLGYRFKDLYAKAQKEHSKPDTGVLDAFWRMERNLLPDRSIPFGSSCFVVMEKPDHE